MSSCAGDGHLNKCVARDNEYLFRRKEILGLLRAAQKLKENRDTGRNVRNAVDIEERRVRLGNVESDSNIGRAITKLSRTFCGNRL